MVRRHPRDVMTDFLDFDARRAVDAGCGDGRFTRTMAERGAIAIGIDVDAEKIARATAATPVRGETFLVSPAEDMPFDDASQDIVVFFGSLHHIAPEHQATALAEAHRVLIPDGELFISEPLAVGPRYELTRAIDDRAAVRASALHAIRGAVEGGGFDQEGELVFIHERLFDDFDSFRNDVVRDDRRGRSFAAFESELREKFATLGTVRGGKTVFDQPIRVNLLRKRG
jgi:SAM-dependent methyltransferase